MKKKKRKFGKPVSWVVVFKDGEWNAAIDNHVDTVKKLKALGWEIMGYPSMKDKQDAIDYIKALQ